MSMLKRHKFGWNRIPIAWLQLKYQRNQTIAGIIGIFCITFLLFIQIGLRDAFLEGALQLPLNFEADIVLMSSLSATALQPVPFSSNPLDATMALEEVESVAPLYITSTQWYDREQSLYRIRVNVIGIPLHVPTLKLVGVQENLQKLDRQEFALFDRNARHEFSPIIRQFNQRGEALAAIRAGGDSSLRELKVTGLFELGVNNAYDATFLTSPGTFSELFGRDPGRIDLGLIRLKPGSDVEATVQKLRQYLPGNLKIVSKATLIDEERTFHENNSPIGFIFRFSLIMAVAVSIFILYQILYVKVTHNLGNYATLKALGFRPSALILIVLQEAMILGIAGYIPGAIASTLAYNYLADVTKIVIGMTPVSMLTVLSLVWIICLISASLSMLKLKDADPVDVFS